MKFTLAVLAFAAPVLAAEESTTAEKEPTKWSGIPKVDLTLWYLNGSYQTVVNAQGTVELELLTVVHGPAQNDGYQIGTYSQLVNPAKVDDVEMYETSIAFTEWKKENKKPLAASTVKFLSAYDATKLNKNWFNLISLIATTFVNAWPCSTEAASVVAAFNAGYLRYAHFLTMG